jgi:serum/glucocorticoid-regulated kinase 3
LPKKKIFGDNFDPDFVLKRQHALNAFVQEAINYPNILKM